MLFEIIFNIIGFFLKVALWIVMGLLAIPAGLYFLLFEFFPGFVNEANAWFWIVFSVLTFVSYYILWKPIVFIAGAVNVLSAGQ